MSIIYLLGQFAVQLYLVLVFVSYYHQIY